jgi:D-sedoheptulose 7-phosphate isomerase
VKDAAYIEQYLKETESIAKTIDQASVARMVRVLRQLKADKGRLFILGVGGSAGNASHAVNDFRKIAGIESYAPTDNVSELTARINDISWADCFSGWLEVSQLRGGDALLVLSVGGGGPNVSQNLVKAMDMAKAKGAKITAIVSRDGGYAAQIGDAAVIVPVVDKDRITPHAEGWQAVVWHMVVNAVMVAEG